MGHLLKVRIRKAVTSDINPFWNFFVKSIKTQFPEYSLKAKNHFLRKAFSKRNFINWLKKKERVLLLVLSEGKVIGYLLADFPYGGVSFVTWMAIDEKFQGKGIGSLLLKEYETIAKKQKAHKISLWTYKKNLKFYEENGYILVGNIPKSWFKADHWLFYKEI